jgi:hypothetical protein
MRSWHTTAGFGAMQGMDLHQGETRTLIEEAWVAGSLAVGAWSTPAAPLENPRIFDKWNSVEQCHEGLYRNSVQEPQRVKGQDIKFLYTLRDTPSWADSPK